MQKLINLLRYLTGLRVTENEVIPVVDDTHGTERLKSADGRQVVVSYPSLRQTGETSNSYQDQLPAAIFVLEKAMAGHCFFEDERSEEQWPASVQIKMNSNNICRCSLRSI